ncbi:hypothetical protein KKY_3701 [Pelagibacterium halotolerans B2]|uniref:Uncharacterized protein n=1 Tax=Pelagibacterium halotolerans (strain DSM 22347 / JCM 15775 / CGMCC 1.7692 / B2) TaxID=1082931 RepID=G4RBP2_PELHB|nr:hypothetical protein KKY_3701 [Pelagibacterium halotolerans B2]
MISPTVRGQHRRRTPMNSIIYLVGLVVVVMAILSFIGLA